MPILSDAIERNDVLFERVDRFLLLDNEIGRRGTNTLTVISCRNGALKEAAAGSAHRTRQPTKV